MSAAARATLKSEAQNSIQLCMGMARTQALEQASAVSQNALAASYASTHERSSYKWQLTPLHHKAHPLSVLQSKLKCIYL